MRRFGFVLFLVLSVSIATFSACGGGGGGGTGGGPDAAQNMAVALRSGQIAIVDLSDYSIAATYNVGYGLKAIDISPDKQFFYATDSPSGGSPIRTLLWVVNVSDGSVADSIDLGGTPWGVKVHPDGSKAYVTLRQDNLLAVVDLATNSVASTIGLPVSTRTTGLDISPDGSVVCVANYVGSISFVDTSSQAVTTRSLPAPAEPWDVAISPDGNECWTGSGNSVGPGIVSVYSTSTYALAATIKVSVVGTSISGDPDPKTLAFTPDGNRVFVAGNRTAELMVLDPTTHTQTGTIITSTNALDWPRHLAADFDNKRVFLSSQDDALISVIDLTTDTEVNVINFPTGSEPGGMVLY